MTVAKTLGDLSVPASPRRQFFPWLVTGGFVALIVWSGLGTQVDLGALFGGEGRHQMAIYVKKLFPPDLSASMLREASVGAVETFAISFVGSLLAVLIALPLSVLTTRTILYRGILYEGRRLGPVEKGVRIGVYALAKAILNVLRTIPEIVWALIFVFLVGLGPFPGALALGVHTGGVLGKLFGEVLEDVDPSPLETLQSAGATRLQVLFYGILPQALPQWASYALYRWEVNIRAAAVLGFVGAGGLGQRIYIALSLFLEHQLLTFILAIYVMVTLVDGLSAWLRRRLV